VRTADCRNYIIPPYNGIGANEYIVDVTHEVEGPDGRLMPAVDFDFDGRYESYSELNIWYHTLNCGYRPESAARPIFPASTANAWAWQILCEVDGKLDFNSWCEGIRNGAAT